MNLLSLYCKMSIFGKMLYNKSPIEINIREDGLICY